MKILCVSDQIDPLVYSTQAKERFSDIDLVLCAGDLPSDYIDFIVSTLNKPTYFIFGNHNLSEFSYYHKQKKHTGAHPTWQEEHTILDMKGSFGAIYVGFKSLSDKKRSLPLKREIEKYTGVVPKRQFMCYSGIPSHFSGRNDFCDVKKTISRFIYVGSFIKRKYPEKVLLGLVKSSLREFSLDYVGDGVNRQLIENYIKGYKLENRVKLHGFVAREQVPSYIGKAQCFVMISEEETFGLVYLEAMSMGCLTIASKNEGMEGIIEDGVNGFLCKAGDEEELANIISKMNSMSQEELNRISQRAIATAQKLTDSAVAKTYIESILNKSAQ